MAFRPSYLPLGEDVELSEELNWVNLDLVICEVQGLQMRVGGEGCSQPSDCPKLPIDTLSMLRLTQLEPSEAEEKLA